MGIAFRCSNNIVAIRKQTGDVSWGVGDDVEDMPHVFCGGEGGPLQSETKSGGRCGDGDVESADTLSLVSK